MQKVVLDLTLILERCHPYIIPSMCPIYLRSSSSSSLSSQHETLLELQIEENRAELVRANGREALAQTQLFYAEREIEELKNAAKEKKDAREIAQDLDASSNSDMERNEKTPR